jgi:alkylated DNA repair dioxygenase AlkB
MRQTPIPLEDAPPSFEYYPEIITAAESDLLAERLMRLEFVWHAMRGRLTKRKMHCFGWNYETQRRTLAQAPEQIPDWLLFLRDLCAEKAGAPAGDFQQAIVTYYGEKDAKIGPHIDAPVFGPIVLGVSLGSAVEMVFERAGIKRAIELEPRSLYVMKDEARYQWKHAICKTPSPPRLSVVFRNEANSASAANYIHEDGHKDAYLITLAQLNSFFQMRRIRW